jgi:RND family efflux transporter MFP subunit
MRSNVIWLTVCSVAISGCGHSSSKDPATGSAAAGAATEQSALTVAVIVPDKINAAQVLDTAGGLFAWQEVAVGAEVSGYRVAEVLVDVGSKVRKGDVLARLDDTLLRESLNQAQAQVAVVKATLNQAQASANRGNTLLQTNVISKQDVEQLNTTAATAAAQLISAESQLQATRQRLDYAVIRAPDAGVISVRNILPGQIANTGTTLFSLIRQSRVEWRAEISAVDIGRVHAGMPATVQRADGTKASGKVRTVSPGLDATSQRGIAYVDLALEPLIRPGMYVNGTIQLAKAVTLTVPLTAVSSRDGFSYVFVLKSDTTVRQQRVTVGRIINDKVELRDGVTIDDGIVSSGASFLHDGDKVKVATTAAPVEAASASTAAAQR